MRSLPTRVAASVLLLALASTAFAGFSRISVTGPEGEEIPLYNKSYALLIGVSQYTNGWPKLPGVLEDVRDVQAVLEEQGFEVITALNPSKENLYGAFEDFINSYCRDPEARVLIYFAGHGHTVTQAWGDEMGYIIPVEAPNPNIDLDGFLDTAMDMQQIEVYAKKIQSKHAMFIFDACFSGSIFALSRAIPDHITYKIAQPVRQFITSGSANEEVPDESVFRSQFVSGIQGEADRNDDGYVTGAELGEFLQETVVNYSRSAQHPQYGKIRHPKLDKGDFVFVVKEEEPPAVATQPANLPEGGEFNLDDLLAAADASEAEVTAWSRQLTTMSSAYEEVVALEDREIAPNLKVEAWKRFSETYSQPNPYSTEDETMMAYAEDAIAYWSNPEGATRSIERSASELAGPVPGMTFVEVEGGDFMMGANSREKDEKPIHKVEVESFYMLSTEVTQKMWEAVMDRTIYQQRDLANPHGRLRGVGDDYPVYYVSFEDVNQFVAKLNQMDPGKNYRLPTEAEWEYACRAGSASKYAGGSDKEHVTNLAWFNTNSQQSTQPVASKEANSWGLFDMHGNVEEWCLDLYTSTYEGAPGDGSAWMPGNAIYRVTRGGGWNHNDYNIRSARRFGKDPSNRYHNLGFRIVREK